MSGKRKPPRQPAPTTPPKTATRQRGWFVIPLLVLMAGFLVLRLWPPGTARRQAEQLSPKPLLAAFAPLPQDQQASRNASTDVAYVGTAACVTCHSEAHASYLTTGHARALQEVQPANEPPDAVVIHSPSARRYEVARRGGQLWQREFRTDAPGPEELLQEHPLHYRVGSGRFARTYLVAAGDFLVESPLTWYAQTGQWGMSPGYDRADHRSFFRAIGTDCLFCHSGQATTAPDSPQIRFHELVISCERCHGPGELHVAQHQAAADATAQLPDPTIVHPGRLSRERREAVCQQCHLTSTVQVAVRGRGRDAFRPSHRWQDFLIDYEDKAPSDMTVVGHVAQLRQSRCHQHSESLTCTSCHAAHPTAATRAHEADSRSVCLSCHAEGACGLPPAERAEAEDRCVHCHMPRTHTDVPHVAFTHHRIGVHLPPAAPAAPEASSWQLAPVLDVQLLSPADQEYHLGLAYVQYYRDHAGTPQAAAALQLAAPRLQNLTVEAVPEARLALAQAELAAASGNSSQAARHAADALRLQPDVGERVIALRWLAGYELSQGRMAAAKASLQELTRWARDPRDWLLLGICLQRSGDLPAARAALEQVLQIDSGPRETYRMLAPIYAALGDAERHAWAVRQAR